MADPHHTWHPIEDYEADPATLAQEELCGLSAVWLEQREALEADGAFAQFNEALHREWAVETGLVEQVYTLDRGITQILIERGIDAAFIPHRADQDPEQVAAMIRDHKDVIEGLFSFVRGDRPLSTSFVKELHAQLTRHQSTASGIDALGRRTQIELLHGTFKKRPNNPTRHNGSVHEYCPPEQVDSEMERLLEMYHAHEGVAPEVEAAWLHHRFTQIHPFQDGNGRVARTLASLVFLRAGWFPLVIRDTRFERERYIDALETADRGRLEPLVRAFSASQKKAMIQALGLSREVLPTLSAEQVIRLAREQLTDRDRPLAGAWEEVRKTAEALFSLTRERLREIARSLESETAGLLENASFRVDFGPYASEGDRHFRALVVEVARQLDYYANTRDYRAWSRLVLEAETRTELIVSFHVPGAVFRGLLAASVFFVRREETEPQSAPILSDLTPLSEELFQVNYRESVRQASSRYREWLEAGLVRGLELWRKTL